MTTYTDPGYIADVVGTSGRIEATWGNAVRDRLVHRFASTAARAAAITVPTEGMMCVVTASGSDCFYVHNGTQWLAYDYAWHAWSPSLSWSSGGGSTGNATVSGYYLRRGTAALIRGSFAWGSTTSAGVGQMLWNLPFTTSAAAMDFGSGQFYDSSASTPYPMWARETGASVTFLELRTMHDAALVTTSAPVTPATGDIIQMTIEIERSTFDADETAT